MYNTVAGETAAAWIMSWLVALLPNQDLRFSRVCGCYLGHGLMSNCTHTHTHTHPQTHTYNKLSIYSWLPIVFTVANTFPCKHLNLSLATGLCLSFSLCATWQGANLGPYLCLQLCLHSLLCEHLICNHCQSQQIKLPAAASAQPFSCPYMSITNIQTMDPPARSISHTAQTCGVQVEKKNFKNKTEVSQQSGSVQVCWNLSLSMYACWIMKTNTTCFVKFQSLTSLCAT